MVSLRPGVAWWGAAAIAALCLAVYAPVLDFEFVDFDDNVYVTENPWVRDGLTLEGARTALRATRASNWHPVTWLSHMTDVELLGLDPGLHHASSLAWHLLNVLLVFCLVRALVPAHAAAALWTAGLFALHPTNVESVAWVAERKNLVSTTAGLVCVLAHLRFVRTGSRLAYVGSWVALALGLAAKPMLVTMPFLLLLIDGWPLGRWRFGVVPPARALLEKAPFFALSALSSVITFLVQRSGGAVRSAEQLAFVPRSANAVVSYVKYLGKLLFPTDLALLYQHPWGPGGAPPSWWLVAACALLLAAGTVAAWRLRGAGFPWVGWLWYLGTLVPVIGIVQVGAQGMADRYLYWSALGPFLVLGVALARLRAGWATAVLVVALAGCAWATHRQVGFWADSVTLFRRGLEVSPRSHTLLYNLGVSLEKRGDLDGAAEQYRAALALVPREPGASFGLANALAGSGRLPEAVESYRVTLASRPDHVDARFNLANTLGRLSREAEAAAEYREVLERDPGHVGAAIGLARELLRHNRADEAVRRLAPVLASAPEDAALRHAYGVALTRAGRLPEATRELAAASTLRPGWSAPTLARAWLLATEPSVRDPRTAIELTQQVLAAEGPGVVALDTLAAALAAAGRFDEAASAAERALRLAADSRHPRAAAVAERLRAYRLRGD